MIEEYTINSNLLFTFAVVHVYLISYCVELHMRAKCSSFTGDILFLPDTKR